MEKTIIRNDKEGYTLVNLKLDKRKVFTPYFMDWLHEVCIAHIAKSFAEDRDAESLDGNLKKIVCRAAAESAAVMVIKHMAEITCDENRDCTFQEIKSTLIGGDDHEM